MKKLLMVTILLALASAPAFSQSNATLYGNVTDATQAVLPGVTVKATNIGNGHCQDCGHQRCRRIQFCGHAGRLVRCDGGILRFPDSRHSRL